MPSRTNTGKGAACVRCPQVAEYIGSTDRRPKPNVTECKSITSGLSFPSFRYRSGWNSMGLLKILGSCDMDLIKNVRAELSSGCSYWPCISEDNCTFWNIITIVFIVVSSHVRDGFWICQDGGKHDERNGPPRGSTICQRANSLTMALIYGREGRSSKSGRRFGPTTTSISAWACFWTSGCSAIVRNRAWMVEVV